MPILASTEVVSSNAVGELAALRPPVRTVEVLLERDVDQLVRDCEGLTRAEILSARRAAAQYCLNRRPSCLGDEVSWGIPLGSPGLDSLLGPLGFPAGWVSEVDGPSASGKTQLCLTVAANALAAGKRIEWIQAGSCSYSAARLADILRARHQEDNDLTSASRVAVGFTPDARSLVRCLEARRRQPTVVIVDAPCAVLAPNLGGDRNHLGRRDLALVAHGLAKCAKRDGALVLCVNATVRPDEGGAPWKPALGLAWTYAASLRVSLHANRTATLAKHPAKPTGATAKFAIAAAGLVDPS